jgi:hypothetical protein
VPEQVSIWWRAFSIVSVTAVNVTQISAGHYAAAFCTGGLLSFIWWVNARTAAKSEARGGQWAYAFGAACGTVTGMFLGRVIG